MIHYTSFETPIQTVREVNMNYQIAKPNDPSTWNILLVDDVSDNLLVAEMILNYHGAQVATARNGKHALEVLKTFRANVIALDLSMPEMTGWEMMEILREQSQYCCIPVIAVTAHAMRDDERRVMQAGFSGYISKPYDARILIENIKRTLSNFHKVDMFLAGV
jgi:two-component system cell cycle response regulator DivK